MENSQTSHADKPATHDPITIMPWLSVTKAADAVNFYRTAFGATTGEVAEFGGAVQVAELFVGTATFWVQEDDDLPPNRRSRAYRPNDHHGS